MEFVQFKHDMQKHVYKMLEEATNLFVVNVDKDVLWSKYLDSFPQEVNPIFRKRSEHDCFSCRHFVKAFGNIVQIKDNKKITIWDFETGPEYAASVRNLANFIAEAKISDVFITKLDSFGVDKNYEAVKDSKSILTWEHLYVKLPARFVMTKNQDKSEAEIAGGLRDVRNVFKRSLEEITIEATETVLELIAQESLYKGLENKEVLKIFLKLQKEYQTLTEESQKENYAWVRSLEVGSSVGKLRGHLIGTLLVDISKNVELEDALRMYEAKAAPSNYKRPKAVFSPRMLEEAKKKLEADGHLESLPRRFAVLDDITVNNVLYADRDSAKRLSGNVFDEMSQGLGQNIKSFDRVEEISIEDFVKNVLPTTKKLQAFVENRHISSLVSLIAPKNKDAKTLFKWNNGFSWAYAGNITDSMKERVKAAGGNIEGVLRFSIQWNDAKDNNDDLDAHCFEPNGNHIYFGSPRNITTTGMLDVDIRVPGENVAVENITWTDRSQMKEGVYLFRVNNFVGRGAHSGFTAEIEFDGQVYSFAYNQPLRTKQDVDVAKVKFDPKTGFTLTELLPSSLSSRNAWGLSTNQFHPVSILMRSPNYWDEQKGVGHEHFFFMLKDCVNPENPNGFFNEYLREEFMPQKRVFEALGSKMRVEDVEDQLSGLGFSNTKRNTLVCKVEGSTSRVLKIKF